MGSVRRFENPGFFVIVTVHSRRLHIGFRFAITRLRKSTHAVSKGIAGPVRPILSSCSSFLRKLSEHAFFAWILGFLSRFPRKAA